jgi:hypothetical protein
MRLAGEEAKFPLRAALLLAVGFAGLVAGGALLASAGVSSPLAATGLLVIPGLLFAAGLGQLLQARRRRTPGPLGRPRVDHRPAATAGQAPYAIPAARGPAPVPVPVGRIPTGPVAACLRCGSLDIRPAPLGADALFNAWMCPRCGFRGQPLEFDRGVDYVQFVRELHGQGLS